MEIDLSHSEFAYDGNDLKISVRAVPEEYQLPDGAIVAVIGDINLYSAQAIMDIVDNLIASQKLKVFLDLAQVNYIDSSGLGAFISSQIKLKKIGGFLRLFSPSKSVGYVLTLTKLGNFLQIHNDFPAAIESQA
jgi:anti-sigma B factor antagonist